MTSLNDGATLKTDTKGRVRVPVERREALLDEFEKSGLSGMKFAALVGVKYATFADWLARRRKARAQIEATADLDPRQVEPSQSPRPVRLFEAFAEVGRASVGAALRVELPGGGVMVLESPGQLRLAAELLQMLTPAGGRR
jgi:hypothetical protein